MALKDLTTSSARLTEQQIEEVIAAFVRFDPDAGVVVLLPAASRLSNRQRVLVYLTALQGWPFVTDKAFSTTVTPAEMSKALGIPGGTIRPLLQELKSAHFVSAVGRQYSVGSAALDGVRAETNVQPTGEASHPENSSGGRRSRESRPLVARDARNDRPRGKRHGGESGAFVGWVTQGFFRQPKTFREVLDHFHSQGRLIKSTSLPGYLLEAVRAGVLTRVKRDVEGRRVWVYQQAN
jgi:hypothetical protein